MNSSLHTKKVGIDIGSTTFKLVIVNDKGDIIYSDYRRHNTNIKQAIYDSFKQLFNTLGDCDMHITMTGSVGMGYAEKAGIRFVQEVVAAAEVVKDKYPQVKTFIDIGGEDSKMIFFEEGKIPDIRMNGNCAGGTGAFIDQTAALLEIDTKELDNLATSSNNVYPIASRCGVFSKTDIQNLISRNVSKNDIAASVFNAVAIQVISSLAKGSDINPKIFLCGGPFAFLPELKKAFLRILNIKDSDCILPETAQFIPAWGCAMISKQKGSININLKDTINILETTNEDIFSNDMSNRLPSLFKSENDFLEWQNKKIVHQVPRTSWQEMEGNDCYIGVDSGSTTTKLVVLDNKKRIVFQDYSRNKGDSFNAFLEALKRLQKEAELHNKNLNIVSSTTTGYGENLIKTAFNLNHGIVETMAHYLAAREVKPDLSFILDIGGQDMKAIYIENGSINKLEINEACSSGCGSFIENFANMLNYPVAEFAQMSCFAKAPYDLGTRCTVFMNSKVKQAMREGAATEDIAAGFSYSVIKNCLFKVLKIKDIKELGDNIVVQGGTFKNLSIVRALEILSGKEVYYSDIPELMGAYGAALHAANNIDGNSSNISQIINSKEHTIKQQHCHGCENQCIVKVFKFSNGNTFFSGNNCEKIFSNKSENSYKGINQHEIKYNDLFGRNNVEKDKCKISIGIPRALGMYENYPFWHTLLTSCNINVVLSSPSSNSIYQKGIRTIMADNICFPAKLMHGHIIDLIEKKVDRILYPYVIFEQKEDTKAKNSYNCPIVAGYSDVIKSSIDTYTNNNIPFDSPIISFNDEKLLIKACDKYLESLNIDKKTRKNAINKAVKVQNEYLDMQYHKAREIFDKAQKENRMVILLACRPYHIDQLIQHKIAECISDMGIDVITENIANKNSDDIYDNIHSITQWTYPNRIFKAANFVAQSNANIHFVQLTSFGCGPDAFITDEISNILNRKGKNLTLLKIDDVNNIGSLRLRIRSVIESIKFKSEESTTKPFITTKAFNKEDRRRTILIPYFAEGYSELLPAILKLMNYNSVLLPQGDTESVELGLKYANNEICYPATIVIGTIMNAIKSGKYNVDEIAVAMTQTGGQCRASNYIALIKNALVSAGYQDIPVVSIALDKDMTNIQPGFEFNVGRHIKTYIFSILYADALAKLYYPARCREKEKDNAKELYSQYFNKACPLIENENCNGLIELYKQAVDDFKKITIPNDSIPTIGVVGEIYIKYNSFGHKHVVDWLSNQGIEVIAPSLYNFFINSFVNNHINKDFHIKKPALPMWFNDAAYKLITYYAKKFDTVGAKYPYYRKFTDIFHDAKLAMDIISPAANFGEGWLIPAEIASFATSGVNNVISLQPFGCIANHVISKGIEKRVKKLYPQMNILSLDFDSGTSEANVLNRLHFMVENCKKQI